MSSSTAPSSSTTSSSTSAPDSTQSSDSSSQGGTSSSTLYLFTFLATLFVLLFISCAIVLRSFILRRRFRRSVDDALATGVFLPKKRRLGAKPQFHEAWVAPGGEDWEYIQPVSVQSLQKKASPRERTPRSATNLSYSTASLTSTVFRNPFSRRPASSPFSSPPDTPGTPLILSDSASDIERLQISVLIAMPSPYVHSDLSLKGNEASMYGDNEDEVPDVAIGVTQLPLKKDDVGS